MRKSFMLILAVFFVGLIMIPASVPVGSEKMWDVRPGVGTVQLDLDVGKFPLYFTANQGQVNKNVRFYARASRCTLWLTKEGLVFDSIKRSNMNSREGGHSVWQHDV